MNRHIIQLALLATFLLVGLAASVTFGQTVAYTGATIETMGEAGTIENGTLVTRDGKIVDVGADVSIPDDARTIPLNGMTIIPGLIDPYFVFKKTSTSSSRTVVFRGRTFTIPGSGSFKPGNFTTISEYFYPYTFNFKPGLRSGITVANLVSDGRGLSAYANLAAQPTPDMLFQNEGYLFAKVTNQTAALDVIRKPLAPPTTKKPTTRRPPAAGSSSAADKIKSYWDAVRDGKSPIFVNVNNAASVAYLMSFLKQNKKIRLVLVATGPNIVQSIDDLLENKNVTVVLQPGLDRVPFKSEFINVSQTLAEKKIPFAISMSLTNSQMLASQDDPLFPLAMLVKTGLDRNTALQSVTIKPAKLLGIEKTHGSIEKGKFANFLVFDGDPLQTGSRLQQVILNGKKTDEN